MPSFYDMLFPIKEGEVVDAESKGLWLPGIVTHVVSQEGSETMYSVRRGAAEAWASPRSHSTPSPR
jgi:hypothetical protein